MVAGKVRMAMGLQKSPANPKHETPPPAKPPSPSPSSAKASSQKTAFSRSFGVYFPRSSAQVQPRPVPDVAELLRLVEELRERESLLKTELVEHKLVKASAAIVPVLESEIAAKNTELELSFKKIESLQCENERLKEMLEQNKRESEKKMKEMEQEIEELKKAASERSKVAELSIESDELSSSQRFQGLVEVSVKSNLIKNLKRAKSSDGVISSLSSDTPNHNHKLERQDSKREEPEGERPRHSRCNSEELAFSFSFDSTQASLRSRVPRVPNPPPKPSSSSSLPADNKLSAGKQFPPPPPPPPSAPKPLPAPAKSAPPPPPPPPKGLRAGPAKVRRIPEVVEFYHSLMRRDSRRDSGAGQSEVLPATSNARDMIGEIENRSAHLLAIKTDVETQGDFIRYLIKEVESAAFTDIEDVVPFVKWLDDELSYLVDERAVLKHFDWPEQKADALREAAFGYFDLKKLETEASSFHDDARQPCGLAFKKMQALLEKLEHGVYNLSRMRESATKRYRGFQIPMDWMLETGIVSQIKLASVKLAMKYMKRVSAELETVGGSPEEEELIVQGVRFAFRVHQFAGGFDVETMRAFQELRDKARSCHIQCQNQHQQKLVCRTIEGHFGQYVSIFDVKDDTAGLSTTVFGYRCKEMSRTGCGSWSLNLPSTALKSNHPSVNILKSNTLYSPDRLVSGSYLRASPRFCGQIKAPATAAAMEAEQSGGTATNSISNPPMKLLFVEMGVGYDQHGQDVTAAAMRACRDAISSNSIPAFRRGASFRISRLVLSCFPRNGSSARATILISCIEISGLLISCIFPEKKLLNFVSAADEVAGSIPGVSFEQMKLLIKLGVPHSLQQLLDIERVKSVFPYGKILDVEVVDGGLICSSGVQVEEMGDKNDDCYIVNAAVYVGY
ncbi:hypothetical protein WN944_012361 [Citrus x changshan-huyou]|uniref:Protein CHUP1, chloroplastic n=1 Tax=Citrus x changshan-huyou TaxID=2935761 RepID=A0AAP0N1I4_9ROSI